MESIAVRNLSFRYPGATKDTLRSGDFRVEAGDFAVLIGATGSGKSTLLRLLKPELAPLGTRSGEIRVAGEAVPAPGCLRLPKPKLAPRGTRGVEICVAGEATTAPGYLRLLKPKLAPLGVRSGEIHVAGEAIPAPGYLRLLKPKLAPLSVRGGEIRFAGEVTSASGYSTGRRTRFALFRLRGRDVALIVCCLVLSGVTILATAIGALNCEFYPRFAMGEDGALGAAGYACYALLELAPAILEWEEKLRWKALRSET